MSAAARDYVYIVKVKKDTKPIPTVSKERLTAAKVNISKFPVKK